MSSADLASIAARLQAAHLAPVIDAPMSCVRALCPVCGSPDPDGIWRSLIVATFGGLRIICNGGCPQRAVHEALRSALGTKGGTRVA